MDSWRSFNPTDYPRYQWRAGSGWRGLRRRIGLLQAARVFDERRVVNKISGKCANGQQCLNRWLCFMFRNTPANCIRQDKKPEPDKFKFQKFGLIDK
jgi:hypothetical protein